MASSNKALFTGSGVRLESLATSHISFKRAFNKTTSLQETLESRKTIHTLNQDVKLETSQMKELKSNDRVGSRTRDQTQFLQAHCFLSTAHTHWPA